jgi:hypothetical protein
VKPALASRSAARALRSPERQMRMTRSVLPRPFSLRRISASWMKSLLAQLVHVAALVPVGHQLLVFT